MGPQENTINLRGSKINITLREKRAGQEGITENLILIYTMVVMIYDEYKPSELCFHYPNKMSRFHLVGNSFLCKIKCICYKSQYHIAIIPLF